MTSLVAFPEELLVRILALCVAPPPVLPARPTWDIAPPPTPVPFSSPVRALSIRNNCIAPLLVCRQFLRIASPLFYHTLHLHSATQTHRLLATLQGKPSLAHAVRRIVFTGIWTDGAAVLLLCVRVDNVDVCLDSGPVSRSAPPRAPPAASLNGGPDARNNTNTSSPGNVGFSNHPGNGDADLEAEAFCTALARRDIVHLTIRKDPGAYLTHTRPQYVLQRLAQLVCGWKHLDTVHLALRISASPITLLLAEALSSAPRLHTVRAQLPAVWNPLLLIISANPALERVMLYSEPTFGLRSKLTPGAAVMKEMKGQIHATDDKSNIEYAVLGTGLYMLQARKHARLADLIKAGTAIIRTRAQTTLATVSSQQLATATPLGATRAKQVAAELLGGRQSRFAETAEPSSMELWI